MHRPRVSIRIHPKESKPARSNGKFEKPDKIIPKNQRKCTKSGKKSLVPRDRPSVSRKIDDYRSTLWAISVRENLAKNFDTVVDHLRGIASRCISPGEFAKVGDRPPRRLRSTPGWRSRNLTSFFANVRISRTPTYPRTLADPNSRGIGDRVEEFVMQFNGKKCLSTNLVRL